MTAPDPRPHAAPTDLVTAEDVAVWLREHAEQWRLDAAADPSLGAHVCRLDYGGLRALQGAIADLTDRLDRERRQACRRGARYEITIARAFWRAGGGVQQMLALAHVQCALAFRAAARAK